MQAICLYIKGCVAADDGRMQAASVLFSQAQVLFQTTKRDSWVVKCMIQQAGILFDCGFYEAAAELLSFPDGVFQLDQLTNISLICEREMIQNFIIMRQAARN